MVKEQSFFELNMPTKLYCGIDSVNKLPELCRRFGDKILLVVPNELLKAKQRVLSCLNNKGYSIETFYLESCEPTCVFIDSSAKRLRRKSFDCIIGLGGGSAMDMAKALSIVLTHSEPIWMYANLSNR
ncbi:MAG: iron-containing alcohol dehydrogenase, partial [Candidatus Anammoxibacter sp.]